MMDDLVELYRDCGRQDQSETFNNTNDEVTVIELSIQETTGLVQFRKSILSGSEKAAWINEENPRQERSIILQLIQVTLQAESYSTHRGLDVSEGNYNSIIQKFGLLGLVKYGTSATQVFNQVSESFDGYTCTYSVNHIDDYFTLFHKYNSGTRIAQGIYFAGIKILPVLEKAIFHQRALADHPAFLNLCTVASFDSVLDSRLCTVSDELARIERRTGFKVWDLGRYKPAQGDSYALSATVSGYATSLAANRRLNRLLNSSLESCGMHTIAGTDGSNDRENQIAEKVSARSELLLQRNKIQFILIDFLTTRLQTQLTALFNLITQTDTRITISLAKDSRMIASASKHDSSSMKALAAVTIVFLPGTFISSLFSISIFDWRAESYGSILSSRFWIYWVVTLPLTLATILVWLVWTRMEDSMRREQEGKAFADRPEEVDPSV